MFRRDRPRPYITDPIPPGHVVQDTGASLLLEAEARLRHAARQVENLLWADSKRLRAFRNRDLENALLDLRNTLRPTEPGTDVLRETTPARAL